jgi:hypothetical protein
VRGSADRHTRLSDSSANYNHTESIAETLRSLDAEKVRFEHISYDGTVRAGGELAAPEFLH